MSQLSVPASGSSSSEQSRRFMCVFSHTGSLCAAFNHLKNVGCVTYAARSNNTLYIELDKKKHKSFLSKQSSLFESVIFSGNCPILKNDLADSFGVQMRPVPVGQKRKAAEAPQEYSELYEEVRRTGEYPDLSGNVHAILNKEKYKVVMESGRSDYLKDSFDLTLRPWQAQVKTLALSQNDRHILWVFDYTGNAGKSTLTQYLRLKCGFQKLSPTSSHHICGMLNSSASGYVFDLTRAALTTLKNRMQDFFELVEEIKGKYVTSGKYSGSEKDLKSHIVVVFANQLPNLDFMSADRWIFFHPQLG